MSLGQTIEQVMAEFEQKAGEHRYNLETCECSIAEWYAGNGFAIKPSVFLWKTNEILDGIDFYIGN